MREYHEQLRVPLSWWLLAIPIILLFGGELYAGFGGATPIVIYAVFTAIVVAFLGSWGLVRIEVRGGVIKAGRAVLPVSDVGEVIPLDEKQSAQLRGPRADPAAQLLLRPYLKRAVYIAVTDPSSPHPYWLIGSRHPADLAAAIERCRETVA
jgi:hypothetical protein